MVNSNISHVTMNNSCFVYVKIQDSINHVNHVARSRFLTFYLNLNFECLDNTHLQQHANVLIIM